MNSNRLSLDGAARPSREYASAAAVEWSLRFREGRLSQAERIEFVRWLRQSPQNVAEYLRAASTTSALSGFRRWYDLPPVAVGEAHSMPTDETVRWMPGAEIELPTPDGGVTSPRRSRRMVAAMAGALAATLAVVASGALWWLGVIGSPVYTTGQGELRSVRLDDGSELSLAPSSRLRVDFDSGTRKIVLERGEALFHVTKDSVRPFVVRAGRTITHAVGTSFSVGRHAQRVVVTVGDGRVAVGQIEVTRLPFRAQQIGATVSLAVDQQVVVSSSGRFDAVRSVDSQRILAWAQGELIFENETVYAVAARFNQFARIKLRIDDQYIGSRTVSGIFDAHDPRAFVAFLDSVEHVAITRPSHDEIIIGRASSEDPVDGKIR